MKDLTAVIQQNLDKMVANGATLFRSSVTGEHLWGIYLSSFPTELDPIFRSPESSVHNCNHCKNFIRRYGNIVALNKDLTIMTLFDNVVFKEYEASCKNMAESLKNANISNIFVETFDELNSLPYEVCKKTNSQFLLGIPSNVKRYTKEEAEKYESIVKPNETRVFNHFHVYMPKKYVDMSGSSAEKLSGDVRSIKEVFKRGLDEFSLETLNLVLELIEQGSILNGETYKKKVQDFLEKAEKYKSISDTLKDHWVWKNVLNNSTVARFRNEVIGTLCIDIEGGVDLNIACQAWNKKVDPVNFMRVTAPITERQKLEAQKFVEENGYETAFSRRLATLDDIKASEILHLSANTSAIKKVSIFDKVKAPTKTKATKIDKTKLEEVSIEDFMSNILPTCTSLEAYLENRMKGNMVNITTTNEEESKPIFKWSNNYSWSYNGNLAGKSEIKAAVKSRGGQTEAVLRISMHFPNTTDDYDLILFCPGDEKISYFNVRKKFSNSGMLDLDAQGVDGSFPPEKRVENIVFSDLSKMLKGKYLVNVKNYNNRSLRVGANIEIEYAGEILSFNLKSDKIETLAAEIYYDGQGFSVKLNDADNDIVVLSSEQTVQNFYSLNTNEFHKVNLFCLSPNYWGENSVGNKHYFFMLESCKNTDSVRGFYNENLAPELLQHRKVMEVLGSTLMLSPSENQLAGLGFNATVKDELILKAEGENFKKLLRIKF
jgi:hypothetical protein